MPKGCNFLVTRDSRLEFCDRPTVGDSNYCDEHGRIMYPPESEQPDDGYREESYQEYYDRRWVTPGPAETVGR